MGVRREISSRPETLELRAKPCEVSVGRRRNMNVRQR
jgi:hypothetical protein